jgi:DNA-directed RNA polymerase subunit beta
MKIKSYLKSVLSPAKLRGTIAEFDIKSGKDVVAEKGRRVTSKHVKTLQKAGVKSITQSVPASINNLSMAMVRASTINSASV